MTTLIASLSPSVSGTPAAPATAPAAASADTSHGSSLFHDLLSIVNPLQHLPVVSTIYRAVTGDTIKPFERIAGDTLYGGLWGFVSSVANVAFQQITGKDFGDTALALLEGDDSDQPVGVASSAATPYAPGVAQAATAMPTAVVSSEWQATAPPTALQRVAQAAVASDKTSALTLAMATGTADRTLSQRAMTAYGKALALPVSFSGDLAPVY